MGGPDPLITTDQLGWDLSCRDWEDRIRNRRQLIPDLPLWRDQADRAVDIFNQIQLPDVADKPRLETASGEWFRDIVRALFGSLDPQTNRRLIQEVLCLAPKKSSKTSYSAALMLTALLVNERPRAEFLLIAPSKLIAQLAFDQVEGMIKADDDGVLAARFHPMDYIKTIRDRRNDSKLVIKSFDANVLTGVKPVGVLVDELHEIARDSAAERILRQIRGGLLPNPESFLLFITTQSDVQPFGVFLSELMTARNVRDGKSKYPMLPVLYEYPLDIAVTEKNQTPKWFDPALWAMVNPNIGLSTTLPRLITDFGKALDDGESALAIWASQHLNIQIGVGLNIGGWSAAKFWDQCGTGPKTLEELIERSEVIVVGIDGGGLDDLLGFAVLGREKGTGKWLLWSHAWAHTIVLSRRQSEASKLETFQKQGHLTIVDMPGDDVIAVADLVMQIENAGLLATEKAIGVDAVGIGDIVDELTAEDRGIALDRIVGIPQGWKLNAAIKTTERKVAGGQLLHGGLPLMAWAVGNAKVEIRGSASSITKAAAGTAKIDPLMALFDAVSLMAMNPAAARSIYEEEDIYI